MSNKTVTNQVELTKEGLEELQKELRELKEVRLTAVIQRVAKAREYGDLSENAEYHSAKEEQEFVETRVDEIEAILAKATLVTQTKSNTTVGIGSKVTIMKAGTKTSKTVSIVGEYEANPTENKVSSVSPLGKALMGKKKGDALTVKAPAGAIEYTVQDIG